MRKEERKAHESDDLLTRGISHLVVADSIRAKLTSGKTLRIKHGIDPTTADLHLGYAVVYRKLRKLQDMGHTIIFLIGDFTARLGDPTGRLDARTMRSAKEVRELASTYLNQIGKVLDPQKIEVRYNSEWYSPMSAESFIALLARFSAWRLLERDMFIKRHKEGKELRMSELIYPILQAYDSVMLGSDVTVIGSDQLFNETQARRLQEDFGQAPQDIIVMKLLIGTDGREKMSQSKGNYIAMSDDATTQFGKIMSVPDDAIPTYYELLTDVSLPDIRKIKQQIEKGIQNPRDIKKNLAEVIVSQFHSSAEAAKAREQFTKVFTDKLFPERTAELNLDKNMLLRSALALSGVSESVSSAARLIEQGGVTVNGIVVRDRNFLLSADNRYEVKAGKKKFVRFVPKRKPQ